MILPETGRGTASAGRGGGGGSLRKPAVYAARKLRRALSLPEAMLWRELRGKKLGLKVRRQHPFGPYVVDFYIAQCALAIEVDGEAHNRCDRPHRDAVRDSYLKKCGCRIARFTAIEVLSNMGGLIAAIVELAANPLHHASHGPPPQTGEDIK